MGPSTVGAHTRRAWRRWDGRNVSIDREGGVGLPRASVPTYASGREIPGATGILDVTAAPDGGCFALDAAGVVYRYDAGSEAFRALSCLWEATGDPRAICVTRGTIYLAGGGRIQAIARRPLQTRWITSAGVTDPIALARSGEDAFVLDAGDGNGGTLSLVTRHGAVRPVVTGFLTPRDLAAGPDSIVVLEALSEGSAVGLQPACRRFEAAALTTSSPIDATDSVWIAPSGFRVRGREGSVTPSCVALGSAGEVLAGVTGRSGEGTLLGYDRLGGAFVRHSGLRSDCVALAATVELGEPVVYAVDEDGRVHRLAGSIRTRPHPETGAYRGRLIARFDSGETGMAWGDIELEFTRAGSETAIGVRYATTDAAIEPPSADEETESVDSIDGIGPTYAARLEASGIDTVAALAELSVEAARTIVGVEERDVSPATAAEWIDAAGRISAHDGDSALQTVDGIGPTYAARLRAAGVGDLSTLAGRAPETIARLSSAGTLDVPRERVAEWLRVARDRSGDERTYDELEWREISANPKRAPLAARGRYLWVELELIGTDRASPTVSAFRASFPNESIAEHLPSIYRENHESTAFLERYLALFESVFDDVEAGISSLTRYLDPWGIPAGEKNEYVAWLGEWLAVGVRDEWPEAAAREFVARAPELHRMRGTRRGLLAAIELYLDHVEVPRRSWEHARKREAAHIEGLLEAGAVTAEEADAARRSHESLADGDSAALVTLVEYAEVAAIRSERARNPYERLLGCPEGFLVILHPAVADEHVDAISRIVSRNQPAHASGHTIGLERRVRLTGVSGFGFHTYLGVNSELSEPTFALGDAALGDETVIPPGDDGQLDLGARLGEDARLS